MKRILLTLTLLALAGCASKQIGYENFHNHPKNSLRVVTYNVNWGKDEGFASDPNKTLLAINQVNADVFLLQEATPKWKQALRRNLSAKYPYQRYLLTGNGGGKAILSRFPILQTYSIHTNGWYPVEAVVIKTNIGNIQLVNVHLVPTLVPHQVPNMRKVTIGNANNIRYEEIQMIMSKLKPYSSTIIAGDFNEADIGRAVRYLEKIGYKNAHRVTKNKQYSWRYQFGPLTLTRRIDRVFYEGPLKLIRMQILQEGGSDHYPVVVDFVRAK